MHVVHVEDRFETAAGYQVNELVKEQSKLGYQIDIITSNRSTLYEQSELEAMDREFEKKYNNCTIIRVESVFVVSFRYYFKNLFKMIDERNPDIVFLHGTCDFKDVALIQKNKKYLIYRDCHMSWVASHNRFNNIFARVYGQTFAKLINRNMKYERIYALGKEEHDYLTYIKIAENKITMLPHGYNSREMFYSETEREKLRTELGVADDQLLVSYIGKVDKYKQPDLIFDILKNVDTKTMENIVLLFVGNFAGEYEKLFWEKYEKFPHKKRCVFRKTQKYTDLYKYFSAIDICFWPKETTLSSIHAQVCRAIPIMEDQDSNVERVVDSRSLFKRNNLEDAYQKFNYVIDNLDQFDFANRILPQLENRDYVKMVKKLDDQWRSDLKKQNEGK